LLQEKERIIRLPGRLMEHLRSSKELEIGISNWGSLASIILLLLIPNSFQFV